MTRIFSKLTTTAAKNTYLLAAALYTLRRKSELAGDIETAHVIGAIEYLFYEYLYFDPCDELKDVRNYSSWSTGEVCDFILPRDDENKALNIARVKLTERGGSIPGTRAFDILKLLNDIF
ncbi:MAG: hypothetical protein IJ740_13550 [Ruminococcus sp.]|nr:hypothetical protein [Ruminococcus sp.]